MSPELEDYLRKALQKKEFLKGKYFLKKGQICRDIYFIESGLVRVFHKHHTEVTTWFLVENDIFISAKSFFRQVPSAENIIALEDCICWSISRQQLDEICELFPEFRVHRIWITEEYYSRSEERHDELQLRTALERYASLAEKRPDLLYRVPLQILPSYLGVRPSTFNKARNDYQHHTKKYEKY